jgi:hypothetical protein
MKDFVQVDSDHLTGNYFKTSEQFMKAVIIVRIKIEGTTIAFTTTARVELVIKDRMIHFG